MFEDITLAGLVSRQKPDGSIINMRLTTIYVTPSLIGALPQYVKDVHNISGLKIHIGAKSRKCTLALEI